MKREYEIRFNSDILVTPDNINQILLTKKNLIHIAGYVSKILKRKLNMNEINNIFEFMKRLSGQDYYYKPLCEAEKKIAFDFLNYVNTNLFSENIDSREYQYKELSQFTNDENQFKFTSHADRRGVAFIDKKERKNQPDIAETYKALYDVSHMIMNALDPESIDKMFNRIQSVHTTYFHINLPHQIIPLDSRNRKQTGNNTIYTWNLNPSGKPGIRGDLWLQDTVQQVIQMRISPFWIPAHRLDPIFYRKVRLLIHEFLDQTIRHSEFTGPNENVLVKYFHFELEVDSIIGNRAYLVPVKDTFTFRRVIAQVNTITISFTTPFATLDLEPDSGIFSITPGNPTVFTSVINHNLDTGDLIYVQNSNAGDSFDAIFNRENGHYIVVTSPTQFTIAIDSTASIVQNNILVYFGSKRISINLEFIQLEQ